jgi:DNA-binding response OmpR family regulator
MTSEARPRTVLIVDDTPDIVEFLVVRLRGEGFDTLSAYSGQDGLQKARLELPDLIVLDVMMPQLNGFQLCRKLKQDPETADIPVLFLTAKDQPSDRFWAEEVGAAGYLTKPVDPRAVAAEVHRILGTE